MGHLSTKKGQSESIEWRRSKILELSSEGYSQREIAQKLQIGKSAVNRDLLFLRKQARENLQHHIHDKIPEEYQSCMTGMKRNLRDPRDCAGNLGPKNKLQARAIEVDCYKYIMEMTTGGVIITDAIKYVQGQMNRLNKTEKTLLQDMKQKGDNIEVRKKNRNLIMIFLTEASKIRVSVYCNKSGVFSSFSSSCSSFSFKVNILLFSFSDNDRPVLAIFRSSRYPV